MEPQTPYDLLDAAVKKFLDDIQHIPPWEEAGVLWGQKIQTLHTVWLNAREQAINDDAVYHATTSTPLTMVETMIAPCGTCHWWIQVKEHQGHCQWPAPLIPRVGYLERDIAWEQDIGCPVHKLREAPHATESR